ncbi:MAG: HTH domain-containing protein [Spirochaetota bacterium]
MKTKKPNFKQTKIVSFPQEHVVAEMNQELKKKIELLLHKEEGIKDFTPFPKNPTIARIFKEIGLADELGSGVRNLVKYVKIYSDDEPVFIEEDIFKIIIPLKEDLVNQHSEDKSSHKTVEKTVEKSSQKSSQKGSQKGSQKNSQKILELIKQNKQITIEELSNILGITDRAIKKNIAKLKQQGKLKRIGPDKGGYWEVIL